MDMMTKSTYSLRELDGTQLKIPIIGKRIKLFKRRDAGEPFQDDMQDEEQVHEDLDAEEDDDGGVMEDEDVVEDED